jgi:hypothetical protein
MTWVLAIHAAVSRDLSICSLPPTAPETLPETPDLIGLGRPASPRLPLDRQFLEPARRSLRAPSRLPFVLFRNLQSGQLFSEETYRLLDTNHVGVFGGNIAGLQVLQRQLRGG